MDSERAKNIASAALFGFIVGYVLALVQRQRRRRLRRASPLSATIQDTIDRMEASRQGLRASTRARTSPYFD